MKRPPTLNSKKAAPRVVTTARAKRFRGSRFYTQTEQQRAREPMCRMCKAEGIYRPMHVADHIVSLGEGGREGDPNNLQSLCKAHHDAKSAEETRRAITRGRADG